MSTTKFPAKEIIISSNLYLILSICLFSFIPIIGTQLYFRHDDSGILLWAQEFDKSFVKAFSPNPEVNNYYEYEGMGGYYRPFTYLYIMLMQRIFGNEPFFYQLIGGLMMIGTVVFMFKISDLLSNKFAAFISVIVLFVCFVPLFYVSFHVVTPFEYFVQMGCFYFTFLGLIKNKIKYLIPALLLVLPATTRQTTPLVLTAIIIVYFLSNWRTVFPNIKTKLAILCFAGFPVILIPLSGTASAGTILNIIFGFSEIINYIAERLYFYGEVLANGIAGNVIFFTVISYPGLLVIDRKLWLLRNEKVSLFILILMAIIFSIILTSLKSISIFVLLALLILCFILDKTIRSPIIWFLISLGCFIIIDYYHHGYILEAVYGLSVFMGILLCRLFNKLNKVFKLTSLVRTYIKALAISFTLGVVTLSIMSIKIGHIPFLTEKLEGVKVLIYTNKNFQEMLNFLAKELPPNSTVYEFSEEYLGTTRWHRRFFSLKERAENIKVMNIPDSQAMIKLLGRYDIIFKDASDISQRSLEGNKYFIACNKLEKSIAEKKYSLQLIKLIKRGGTEATIYILKNNIS